jgi:uncharacterized PurR-regulated membrane protein YhhQ (DUF165 family)
VAAIVGGSLLSVALSPRLAAASGIAFLLSEATDFAIYTPLEERGLARAVLLSGLAGSFVDAVIFLGLAGIPLDLALPGLLVGKAWAQLVGAGVLGALRKKLPRREPLTM